MAQLDELLPDLAVQISNVPAFIARNQLRVAVQQFCQKSYLWQIEQSIALDGSSRYALEIPEGTLVAGLVAAALDGQPLSQGYDYELVDADVAVMRSNYSGLLRVVIALKPDRRSDTFGDELINHYATEITAGAAAKLGANEKQVWALSKKQVHDYQGIFDLGYQNARKRALNNASRLYEAPTKHEFF